MSQSDTPKPSIGAEIPYRRDQIEKRTGSLVFDRHLDEAVADAPEVSPADETNPLKRGQVT